MKLYDDYSEDAVASRVIEKCKEVNYEFLGFVEWIKTKTNVILKCNIHNIVWSTTKASHFLKTGGGCQECTKKLISSKVKKSDEVMSETFMKSGKFLDGTVFWRSEKRNLLSKLYRWYYTCPRCSNDEYTKAGLCSGIFEASSAQNLQKGKLSCRCSSNFKYTDEQLELRIKLALKKEGKGHEFVSWIIKGQGSENKALINCPSHGLWIAPVYYFRGRQHRCIDCAKIGFKKELDSVLYVIRATGKIDFVGYGITNNHKERIAKHKNNLKKRGYTITEIEMFYMLGSTAIRIENLIKSKFEINPQDVPGFKTEATHYWEFDTLLNFIDLQLEKNYE